MRHSDAARVDVAALQAVAREYEAVGQIVEGAVRTHLSELAFGGSCAGRAYVSHGAALRAALEQVVVSLRQWSRAAEGIAVALRSSAQHYRDADDAAAGRVG